MPRIEESLLGISQLLSSCIYCVMNLLHDQKSKRQPYGCRFFPSLERDAESVAYETGANYHTAVADVAGAADHTDRNRGVFLEEFSRLDIAQTIVFNQTAL